jgi:molybdenum cofactor cytidylyltransferase
MQDKRTQSIAAIVLAAGRSQRMRQPKMILPWGESTVIGHVVQVLSGAEIQPLVVVTGGARRQVEAALAGCAVQLVFNPRFAQEEMLASLQIGLGVLGKEAAAALVVLGDQPQIELKVVQAILDCYWLKKSPLIVPSFQMRRGHPWLVERRLWGAIFALDSASTLRDFINSHADQIEYLSVDTPSILRDLDTPADYRRERPTDQT